MHQSENLSSDQGTNQVTTQGLKTDHFLKVFSKVEKVVHSALPARLLVSTLAYILTDCKGGNPVSATGVGGNQFRDLVAKCHHKVMFQLVSKGFELPAFYVLDLQSCQCVRVPCSPTRKPTVWGEQFDNIPNAVTLSQQPPHFSCGNKK